MRRAYGPSHRPRNRNKDEGRPTNPGGHCPHLLGQTPDVERANVHGQHKQNQQQNDEYHLKEKQNQSPSLWSPQRESPAKIADKQRPDTHPQLRNFPATIGVGSEKEEEAAKKTGLRLWGLRSDG